MLVLFAILQLFQPDRNLSSENLKTELANHYAIPDSVEVLLNTTCYDCHSNNTDYPWFVNVQPIGWYVQSKINKGKAKLNFSEFANFDKKEAADKLNHIENVMNKNSMPINAYSWYNKDAALTIEQREMIAKWAANLSKQILKDSTAVLNPNSFLYKATN